MKGISTRALVLSGLAVCLVIAGVVSFYASSHLDGLEYVAGQLGFDTTAGDSVAAGSPLADYGVAGMDNERLSGGLAGVIGVTVVGAIAFALMWLLRRRGHQES